MILVRANRNTYRVWIMVIITRTEDYYKQYPGINGTCYEWWYIYQVHIDCLVFIVRRTFRSIVSTELAFEIYGFHCLISKFLHPIQEQLMIHDWLPGLLGFALKSKLVYINYLDLKWENIQTKSSVLHISVFLVLIWFSLWCVFTVSDRFLV